MGVAVSTTWNGFQDVFSCIGLWFLRRMPAKVWQRERVTWPPNLADLQMRILRSRNGSEYQMQAVRWRYCTEVFDYLALAALIEVGHANCFQCTGLSINNRYPEAGIKWSVYRSRYSTNVWSRIDGFGIPPYALLAARIAYFAFTAGCHLPLTLLMMSGVSIENRRCGAKMFAKGKWSKVQGLQGAPKESLLKEWKKEDSFKRL